MRILASPVSKCLILFLVASLGDSQVFKFLQQKRKVDTSGLWSLNSPDAPVAPWTPPELGTVECQIKNGTYTFFKINFQASFNISYETKTADVGIFDVDSSENVTYGSAAVNIPTINGCEGQQNYESQCTQINATFSWDADGTGNKDIKNWTLLLVFEVKKEPKKGDLCKLSDQDNWDDFEYWLKGIQLTYNTGSPYLFPEAKFTDEQYAENWNMELFEVDSDSSYKCDSNSSFAIEDNVVEIYFKDYQSQAFQFEDSKKGDTEFDTAKLCSADDDGSSLVPIIVGCVLAGLIILTLVAYFIGRWHQNRQETYQAL